MLFTHKVSLLMPVISVLKVKHWFKCFVRLEEQSRFRAPDISQSHLQSQKNLWTRPRIFVTIPRTFDMSIYVSVKEKYYGKG